MPTADYSSYHQASGTGADGTKFSNFVDAVQSTVNALDKNNLASNAGILGSQLATGIQGPPGTELDYAQITTGATVSGTTSGTATTIITGAGVTYDGSTIVKAIFQCEDLTIVTGHTVDIGLYEDGTFKATLAEVINNAGANMRYPGVHGEFRFTPSAVAHTYSVRAWTSAATTDSVDASATAPAFLQIVKVK